jgi:heptaprenyl diphosphate synthase
MCFQIVDDVLDLTSTDDALGKHAGQDLLEGIYTLPVIYTMRERPELRDLLGAPLDDDVLTKARTLTVESGAMELAMDVAHDHAVKATQALDGADGLDADTCATLVQLVEGLVARES